MSGISVRSFGGFGGFGIGVQYPERPLLAGLCKHSIPVLVAGEPVVQHQEPPHSPVTKAHGVDSLLTARGGHEEAFDELRVIGQHREGGQKPAIAKAALLDVAAGGSGLRKYIPRGVASP